MGGATIGRTMGRPKKRTPGEAPAPIKRIAVQASTEWVEYVERGARFCRTDISKLIDKALAEYLKSQGFTEPPPERTP